MAAARTGERGTGVGEQGGFGAEGEGKGAFGAGPAEGEGGEVQGESLEVGVQEFEMVGGETGGGGNGVHVDGQLADLAPAFGGGGEGAEADGWSQIEHRGRVDGGEGEGGEDGEGAALDGDADGDEGVVDDAATVAVRRFLARTGDTEVLEVGYGGEGADEGGDVGGGVEEGRVLLHQHVRHLPAAVGRAAEARAGIAGAGAGGFVHKGEFFARDRVQQRRQKRLRAVGHVEVEGAHVVADAIQRGHTGRLGQGAGAEGDVEIFEQQRGRPDAEVVAGQAER